LQPQVRLTKTSKFTNGRGIWDSNAKKKDSGPKEVHRGS